MALLVGEQADIRPGERVLSVACGAGDELLLWLQRFGARQVVALEHDQQLVAAGWRAALTARLTPPCRAAGLDYLVLSAAKPGPLAPSLPAQVMASTTL